MPSDEQPVGTESSLADLFGTDEKRRAGLSGRIRGLDARQWVTAGQASRIGAVAVTVFFTIGAWQRRWIADDGLIVLRTLRNLFAGNGPVFNAGSGSRPTPDGVDLSAVVLGVGHRRKLEYVALWVALVLSATAIPLAMYGTARCTPTGFPHLRGWTLLLPPARSSTSRCPRPATSPAAWRTGCASSGSRSQVSVRGVGRRGTRGRGNSPAHARAGVHRRPRPADPARTRRARRAGAAGHGPRTRVVEAARRIVVVAGVLPVGYQIFRMGYYALLVPNPAVAKDASGSKWAQGFDYVGNLFSPYLLVLPLILLIVVAALLGVDGLLSRGTAGAEESVLDAARPGSAGPVGGLVGVAAVPHRGDCHRRRRVPSVPSTGCGRAATSCTAGCCSTRCSRCCSR